MALNIIIKQKEPTVDLTLSVLKKIVGESYVYGNRDNVSYIFHEQGIEDIINVDVVLYTPKNIGRGFIFCVHEDKTVELVLSVPCTTHDVNSYFDVVKRICNYYNATTFLVDGEEIVFLKHLEDFKSSIIKWNIELLRKHLQQIGNNTFVVFGANNPIYIESDVRDELKTLRGEELERKFAQYINVKQQIACYYMGPNFFHDDDNSVMGIYALTENVDSIIPIEPYAPINSGMSDDVEVKRWLTALVANVGEQYDVLGYVNYDDLIKNIPADSLSKYDENHYILKGLSRDLINQLLEFEDVI